MNTVTLRNPRRRPGLLGSVAGGCELLVTRLEGRTYGGRTGSNPRLGLAQGRRTYCHHLILEFLSVHPAIVGGNTPRIHGVGAGILYSLTELAGLLRVPLVWGEATTFSTR